MGERGFKSYNPDTHPEQVKKLCLLGAINLEIADFFNVTEQCLNRWQRNHPEFAAAMREGKMIADANVAFRLHQRACGYSHPEDKIFQYEGQPVIVPTTKHYPPDTAAAIFWLHNRQRDKWKRGNSDGDEIQNKEELLREIAQRLPD